MFPQAGITSMTSHTHWENPITPHFIFFQIASNPVHVNYRSLDIFPFVLGKELELGLDEMELKLKLI